MNRTVALFLPLLLTAATVADAQDPVVRTYSVHDMLAPAPDSLQLPVGPAIPPFDGSNTSHGGVLAGQPNRTSHLTDQALIKWLREVWSDDASAAGDLAGDVLTLRATPGTHAKVQDLLTLLQGVMGRTVGLRIHVLPADAVAEPSGLLDAAAVKRVLEAHAPVRSHGVELGCDVPALFENGRAVYMLRDYDVEVAQRSRISDPKADVVFLGDRLGAAATPMADGRFLLRWGFSATRGELPFPRRALTGTGLGTLDLPVVDHAQARGTAVLAAGEGVLFGGAREAFLLVLDTAASPPMRTGSVAAVPLGPLAAPPLLPTRPTRLVSRPGEGPSSYDPSYELPDLYQALAMYLGTDLGEQLDLTVLGTHAVVSSQGLAQRVESLARQQAEAVVSYSLRFAVGSIAREAVEGVPADTKAARLQNGAWAVTLADQAFAHESWTERAFVRDFDVEIAHRSEAANPIVDIVRDGWSVRGKVHRSAGGLPTLSGRFQWSRLPPITPRDTGIQAIGSIDFPEVCYSEADLRASLRPGTWQVLHQGPDPEAPNDRVLVLMVQAQQR